jgi:hypothetical protein
LDLPARQACLEQVVQLVRLARLAPLVLQAYLALVVLLDLPVRQAPLVPWDRKVT